MKALIALLIFSNLAFAQEVYSTKVKCGAETISITLSVATNLPQSTSLSKVCHRGNCLDWYYVMDAIHYKWEVVSLSFNDVRIGSLAVGVIPNQWGPEASYSEGLGVEIKQNDLTLWINTGLNQHPRVEMTKEAFGVRAVNSISNLMPSNFGLNVTRKDGSFVCNEIANF